MDEKEPAAQAVHWLDALNEYAPELHETQFAADDEPTVAEKVPAVQSEQYAAPVPDE